MNPTPVPTDLATLQTPCLVLDRTRVERNIARMREHLRPFQVQLRPHVKTCKSIDVARLAMETPHGPVTVSTLREAEYFFSHGVSDILYAVGIAPNKLEHVTHLRRRGANLLIILDNMDAARAVIDNSRVGGERLDVLLEIDCDGHRSGIRPDEPKLIEIARALDAAGATLAGVMTHAGASYSCRGAEALRSMAEQERAATVFAASRLREAGLQCPIVSVGSTPTALSAQGLDGVSEVRVGVFMFFDLVMAGIGVCRIDDIAVSVLTSVIGHQAEKGWTIVDAGWMALSRDRGTSQQDIDQGYGIVCGLDGEPLEDLIVIDANQEHGIVARRPGSSAPLPPLPVGTPLRVLPNHACATSAQHERYHVVEAGSRRVSNVWNRITGW